MKFKFLGLVLFVVFSCSAFATDGDMELIMQNIRRWNVSSPSDSIVQSYLDSLGVDGSFNDINYSDQSNTWQPQIHYYRLLSMAYAYISPQNVFYNDSNLYNKIVLGISYWLSIHPTSINWYHTKINEPSIFGLILIAMRSGQQSLPYELEAQVIERWRNNGSNPANYSGSNKSEMALHWMYFACLTESADTLNLALDYIFDPVVYTEGEGLQVDNSFLQHGKQLYIGGYGEVMLETVLQTAVCVAGTDYSMSDEKLGILRGFVLDSYSNVIRGDVIHWNAIGRQLTRPDFLRYLERRIPIIEKMREVDEDYASLYIQILDRLRGDAAPCDSIQPYHAHLYRGDYTLHVRPGYSFGTRMVSTRTCRQEKLNGENLLGYWLSDGSTVITSSGREYLDVMPLWDWNRIPGVTAPIVDTIPVAPLMSTYGTTSFAGGVSDSIYGCSAYCYYDAYSNINTGATKGYFFFDDEIVCLGAGITSSHDTVQTTINQCWGRDEIVISNDSVYNVLNGNINQTIGNDYRWILHDSIGYFFPDTQQVFFANTEKVGNWRWISTMWPDNEITGKVFSLGINHISPAQDEKYSYVIIPNSTASSLSTYAANNNIEIPVNSDSLQVVYHRQLKLYECVFYRACIFNGEDVIRSFQPCALMIQKHDSDYVVHIADPTQSKSVMVIGIKREGMEFMSYYAADYSGIDDQFAGMTKRLDSLSSQLIINVDTQIACESFTWIDGITYFESTSDPIIILTDTLGHDSIVNLHLTINNVVTEEITIETSDSCYVWNGQIYCFSGDYVQTFLASNGCDSIVTMHLTTRLGVEDVAWDTHVYLTPNPAKQAVRIVGLTEPPKMVDVFDMRGCLVMRLCRSEFDVSQFSPGFYLVKIYTTDGIINRKFVKQ